MKKLLLLLSTILCGVLCQAQNSALEQIVPVDTSVRYGVLDNGMTYFVQRAAKRKGVAEFRLVQKTGSLVENDDEKGIAHFLEHMLFKGTKHFPGNSIIEFLQRNGVAFGQDLNAHTGLLSTTYELSSVPIKNTELLDSCLTILHDWSADAIFDAKFLDAERNVVIEEWRTRNASLSRRMIFKYLDGSRYGDRDPLGDMEFIKSCTPDKMKEFYHKWYQPQLQCVIVTGDIDADSIVTKIRNRFSDIKRGNTPNPPEYALPDYSNGTKIFEIRDKSLMYATADVCVKLDPTPDYGSRTVKSFLNSIAKSQAANLLKKRLEKLRDSRPSLTKSTVLYSDFETYARPQMFRIELESAPANYKENLKLVLVELEKALRYGFCEDELRYHIPHLDFKHLNNDTTLIDFNDPKAKTTEKEAVAVANGLVSHFVKGTMPTSSKADDILTGYFKSHTSKEMMNDALKSLFDKDNKFACVYLPDENSYQSLSANELDSIIKYVECMDILCDTLSVKEQVLLKNKQVEELKKKNEEAAKHIVPGKIKKQQYNKELDCLEYTLSNGVKVMIKKLSLEYGPSLYFWANIPGGESLLEDNEIPYVSFINEQSSSFKSVNTPLNLVFTKYTLDGWNFYGGEDSPELRKYNEGQVEFYFCNFYRLLTSTEIDKEMYDKVIDRLRQIAILPEDRYSLALREKNCFYKASQARNVKLTTDIVDGMSLEKLNGIIARLHSNYNGMTLVLQTNFEPKMLLPYIEKYVASLPAKREKSKSVDREAYHVKPYDDHKVAYIDNPEPYAKVYITPMQEKGFNYTPRDVAHHYALANVMQQVLTDKIRFKHSDVYSISEYGERSLSSVKWQAYPISFSCDPEKAEDIAKDVKEVLRSMAEGDIITQELLDSYLNANKRDKENAKPLDKKKIDRIYDNIVCNGLWIDLNDLSVMNNVTVESLRKFVKDLLRKGHIYEYIMRTE